MSPVVIPQQEHLASWLLRLVLFLDALAGRTLPRDHPARAHLLAIIEAYRDAGYDVSYDDGDDGDDAGFDRNPCTIIGLRATSRSGWVYPDRRCRRAPAQTPFPHRPRERCTPTRNLS